MRVLYLLTVSAVVAGLARPVSAQQTANAGPSAQPTALTFHAQTLALPSSSERNAAISEAVPAPAPRAGGFATTGFAQFMASPAGRILRVVAGAGMIVGGVNADSDAGTAVAVVGGVPLLAGTLDFCVISPLFGGPFWGKNIRAAKGK